MNVSSSQLLPSLPERRSALPGVRSAQVQAIAAAAPRSLSSAVPGPPTQVVGDIERLGRSSPANRGGLLLYAVTAADPGSAAGVRVDVRI